LSAFCQTFEPGQASFIFNNNNFYKISAESTVFRQNNFVLGWQWGYGSSEKLTKAVGSTVTDIVRTLNAGDIVDSCDMMIQCESNTYCDGVQILNSRGVQYEPTLEIDSLRPFDLVVRQGDTTRPVFGFRHRRGRTESNSSNPNFNRRIFEGDSLYNQVILSDPWPDNELYTSGASLSDSLKNVFLCRTLYFSINLRREDNLTDNAEILKIELPYWLGNGDSNNIQFSVLPKEGINDTLRFPNFFPAQSWPPPKKGSGKT
jgi:hypothetical protein